MEKNMKSVSLINKVAVKLASQSVNSACLWVHHQPVVPEAAKKLRKF